ncbi:MAG: hypothetical protein A2Z64_11290 [Betaproteobacteria bacterium RIFCSPLOWO2_02_67_12]|nr:MAG: hypothetical protein A2Z64_11290 [Betaproteobacteria bacterium RIFCSPLOWO2_02_67_12]OGA28831.1 MAG: hypothetical protein A3I65_11150 [Betaproteobacteria bacterium RIFCSPLOWO2_02_FULL_68_150]OGA63128.1 MAG: hypothetical protein A3F77_05270 [Betaproteobacteria bacterium RIFCSPLOWO2_12_FULL_67_28]
MKTASFERVLARPKQSERLPPCGAGCATGADIRGWIGVIAQRRKLGLWNAEAFSRAWRMVTEVNPFPATLGRICPHPCEAGCNRAGKDGAVAINALERFLGDWGLRQRLGLQRLEEDPKPESIGVIGAGPAGLSFAYQMARRGYRVTVYERNAKPGGMLQYGIPEYRLPEDILAAEVGRILALGVELKLGTGIGREVSVAELKAQHDILFLGIGALRARMLDIPGEVGGSVWTGTEYLASINRGEPPALGAEVIVVGGGNTAIDAARSARRSGARVTLLYRRTRQEMPAIAAEVEDALAEGVTLTFLAAPVRVDRMGTEVSSIVVQQMLLGEPDASGRRRPVPVVGSEYQLPASALIAAVSQEPDWEGLEELAPGANWIQSAQHGRIDDALWAGGDALGLGIAGLAIANGCRAAEALHAQLRKREQPVSRARAAIAGNAIKSNFYSDLPRAVAPEVSVSDRLAAPGVEVRGTISEAQFLKEVERCFSCGLCFGCEQCFMYCNGGGFSRLEEPMPGTYFALKHDACEGCRKCIELCPCGYLSAEPMG